MPSINPRPGNIAPLIFLLRGERALLSQHLAGLYGVSVSALNQAVKRNLDRFPGDLMFQLSHREFEGLKSQIVTSNRGGLRRALPYAFTEQGIAMLSMEKKYDEQFAVVFDAIKRLIAEDDARKAQPKRCIGFTS
jgi:hypothetical protein